MFARSSGSFQLARIFGIRVGATPSWFLVLFVFIYFLTDYFGDVVRGSDTGAFLLAVGASLAFFGSIVLHELGHAIAARRDGIGITQIDLFFLGGVARLERDASAPGAEFRVAAAGPAVTGAIIGLVLAIAAAIGDFGHVLDTARFEHVGFVSPGVAILGWLAAINVYVLVLNILPAWPLDGGRMLRAILWRITGDQNRATRISAHAGQGLGYLMIGFGIYGLIATDGRQSGIWLVVLGFFILTAAREALAVTAFNERTSHITIGDVMEREPPAIPADTTVVDAHDAWFRRYGDDWFPVVSAGGRFVGALRADWVDATLAGGQPALAVSELLNEESRRQSIGRDRRLKDALEHPGMRQLRGLAVVDAEGVLIGVVTHDRVTEAILRAASGPTGV